MAEPASPRLVEMSPMVFWQAVPSRTMPPYHDTACYWITDGRTAWLVDAGDGGPAGAAALAAAHQALGAPHLEFVVVTHWHRDHSGGVRALTASLGARAVAHPLDAARIAEILPDAPPFEPAAALPPTGPGGISVALIHAPGHTRGQLNVWLPDAGVLLAGDNVLGRTTSVIVPPDGDLRTYQATLQALMDLRPRRIGPGHGNPIDDAMGVLGYYRQHRLERERQLLELLAAGPKSLTALAEAIYRGQPPETVLAGRYMLTAHTEALLAEGRIREKNGEYFLR